MGELRWILLLVGLAFLAMLAAWELRRSRRSRRELSEMPASAATHGEPELGHLPEEFAARARPTSDAPGTGRASQALPPVVELPPLDAADEPAQAPPAQSPEPVEPPEPVEAAESTALAEQTEPADTSCAEPAALRVEWPPEGERQIIAVRIMAVSEQRLSGRTARQALAANGFVHGRYGIFHQPGPDGRALLSCASMSKPGIFDLASMDFQRFAGLSLFMVLPGPLPAQAALERLVETGVELAQRLQAQLQDEQGHALDEWRVEELRNSVRENAAGTMGAQPAEPAA